MKKDNEYSEFRQQLKEKRQLEHSKLKVMTFPEKADYIRTYYKAPILITTFLLIFIISMAYHILAGEPESIMYSMVVNANAYGDETNGADIFDEFLLEEGYDPENYVADRNTSIILNINEQGSYSDPQSFSVLCTLLMTGTVDHMLAGEDVFRLVAECGYIMPLSSYLPEDEIAEYEKEGLLLYGIDPETNQKTAFGIYLGSSEKIQNSSLFYDTPYFGMVYAAPHEKTSIDFLHYLLEN